MHRANTLYRIDHVKLLRTATGYSDLDALIRRDERQATKVLAVVW